MVCHKTIGISLQDSATFSHRIATKQAAYIYIKSFGSRGTQILARKVF